MTGLVLRRALRDYVRRPLNLALLIAVPIVIVTALAGELASLSKLLSAGTKPAHLEVATASWAAAAVAGLAGFFQVVGSRATDRRLAAASRNGATPVVAGRLLAATGLAGAAAIAALLALVLRGGIVDPARVTATVGVVAIIYVAIGVLVGTVVRSEMNGALVVSVIWMLDVFVGSGLGGNSSLITRLFPLHFPTMVLTNQAAHHGGPLSDVGWTLVWTFALAIAAVARLAVTTRPARRGHAIGGVAASAAHAHPLPRAPVRATTVVPVAHPTPRRTPHVLTASRFGAGLSAAIRDYRRNRVLWALLFIVPVTFIALAAAQTPLTPMAVALVDGSRRFTAIHSLRQIHAAEMASIASALLAGITGLFVITGSVNGDRRLVLAGYRPGAVLAARLGVIAGATIIVTATSLAVSAAFLSPASWIEYAGADLLIAFTYAMVGVLIGPLVGRLGGLYVLLLMAIVDVGYGQSVMFHPQPPAWGAFLPARGAGRLLLDGAFTTRFEQYGHLLLALAWLGALSVAAVFTFRFQTGVTHRNRRVTLPDPRHARIASVSSSRPRQPISTTHERRHGGVARVRSLARRRP